MSESVELSEIHEFESELLKHLVFIPQDLSKSSLGCILRALEKHRVFEILVILEGLKQFSPHGEVCKVYQRCRERVIADAIRDRPAPEYFLLLVGFWLVTDEFVLKHFSTRHSIQRVRF
ncbi:Oidioi.mRNA.OKI2018_I69.chr2.g8087.t1.cds [Oikopleura dioica]|uniref:Oidioi.mRNA.OKI2018_I69.chr2.g8087.t1.cds n=1 Tax=Oikopleura dioica TaxID=34765 RepID=A0ABN7TBE3_OIKDI|nr:Oidioi.mRNA.OKI2018_I69.chr2.g8087.t1.cds [Oikopleura dioica]